MLTKPPERWSTDPNIHAIKVEVSANEGILLPFDHFLYSQLKTLDGVQEFRAVFVTHEVVVQGLQLRKIETALQRKELAHLAVIIHGADKLADENQPIILSIVVSETDHNETGSSEGGHTDSPEPR